MSELGDLQKYLTEYVETTSFDKEVPPGPGEDNDNDEETAASVKLFLAEVTKTYNEADHPRAS